MACIEFREIAFRPDKLARIKTVNEIISEYSAQGLRLSLRQLYYQHVAKGILENTERSYKNLGTLVSDGRLAGLIDWDAIEDRGRVADTPSEWSSISSLVDSALHAYRRPRWEGQPVYAELWVEKQALAGVLEPLARHYHATLLVNKGYSSQSSMFESAKRFKRGMGKHRPGLLFYLGDHDPSGEDMVRDVGDRLCMFGAPVKVTKIALTMAQIRQYNPPPNPAKLSDSRAAAYVEKHGDSSWEVDALPPNVLTRLIRAAFDKVIDRKAMDAVIAREEREKTTLKDLAARAEDESNDNDGEE